MSIFDRLQNYSASSTRKAKTIFDITTPEGAFFDRVHREGYSLYTLEYVGVDGSAISEAEYSALDTVQKQSYTEKVSYTELYDVLRCQGNQVINAIAGSGKSLAHGTRVVTETGYRPIEEIKIGDRVYSNDGKLYNVLGVYPQGNLAVYNVKFSDGTEVKCSGDHLWTVYTGEGTDTIKTTQLSVGDYIDSCLPLQFEEQAVEFDPYMVGFVLGGLMSCKEGLAVYLGEIPNGLDIPGKLIKRVLEECEDYGKVCVPKEYIYNTEAVRLRFLNGVVDSCDFIKDGKYIVTSEFVDFIKDVEFICQSLGLITEVMCTPADEVLGYYVIGIMVGRGITKLHGRDGVATVPSLTLDPYSAGGCFGEIIEAWGVLSTEDFMNLSEDECGFVSVCTSGIPSEYVYTSVDRRLRFLEGVLDFCGVISRRAYFISSVEEFYIQELVRLCNSVGLIACLDGDGLYIYPSDRYPVLSEEVRGNLRKQSWGKVEEYTEFGVMIKESRSIVAIEKQYNMLPMTCIEIDAPSHLYLTENCLPTHNTTALVFKILHDIVTGETMTVKSVESGFKVRVVDRVWVCTFLKSGAEELQKALLKWQTKFGYSHTADQVVFSTMDAEFKRCLNAMGLATPIADQKVLDRIFKKAVDACLIKRGTEPLVAEDYKILMGIVTFYRGRLDSGKYLNPNCEDYGLTPALLDVLVNQFADLRRAEHVMDFEEIMELLYKYLYVTPNKAIQDFVSNRYNYVYIDEFQDTSQMAYAILKYYARGNLWLNNSGEAHTDAGGLYTGVSSKGKFTVIGDTSQCILEDEMVKTDRGVIPVRDLHTGDMVVAPFGFGKVGKDKVTEVTAYNGVSIICRIELQGGGSLSCTLGHKLFTAKRIDDIPGYDPVFLAMAGDRYYVWDSCSDTDFLEFRKYADAYNVCMGVCRYSDTKYIAEVGVFSDPGMPVDDDVLAIEVIKNHCAVVKACEVVEGMPLVIVTKEGKIGVDKVKSVHREWYKGCVYDVSTESTHTYVTSGGVVSHNCIYSFRGSDSKILAEAVDKDFRPAISTLSYNWRCPDSILNPVVPSIHLNESSKNQVIKASKEGGTFEVLSFPTYKAMAGRLLASIKEDIEKGLGVAVLCRTNYDGLIPACVLESDGKVDFSVSGSNMTMDSPLPRRIFAVTSLFTDKNGERVKTALSFFISKGYTWKLKELMDTLKHNNISIWQVPLNDISYSCAILYPFIKAVREIYLDENGNKIKEREIEALRFIYKYMYTVVFKGDSAYCESAKAYLDTLLYILDSREFSSVVDFVDEMELLHDRLNGRVRKRNSAVQIATVHEFKGKECDSVYIWNDSEGVFPSNKCDIGNTELLEEERRVHYIACTRAKKKESIYTITGRHGMFLNEMDMQVQYPDIEPIQLKGETHV